MLTFEEVSRLDDVLENVIQIHGRGNFPTLEVKPKKFINLLLSRLRKDDIVVNDVRLNGSTASFVVNDSNSKDEYTYNDLDLIFNVELSTHAHFQRVKAAVLESLLDFMPDGVSKARMSSCTLKEAYVTKMVKVLNKPDTWSLISLSNNDGRNIELKFVNTMRRQFEFSVDSFQIILDSLLNFHELTEVPISSSFYPSIPAVSVYGDFSEALHHLRNKLIATKNPEEIRGGGLLKYCSLLVRDFRPLNDDFRNMERYMCSRFFIDFKDLHSQRQKLENYLNSHFLNDEKKKYRYLMTLYEVVENSTVCLMFHERKQTLRLIMTIANQLCQPPKYQQITVFYSVPQYLHSPRSPTYAQTSQEFIMLGTWKTAPNFHQHESVPCF